MNRLDRFETLSVQRHTVSEGLFYLLLFCILTHGFFELHLVHLFDLWVSDLHPGQGIEVGEVIDFHLLKLVLRYLTPIQADCIVFKLDRAFVEGNRMSVTEYPLQRMNWSILAIHVFNSQTFLFIYRLIKLFSLFFGFLHRFYLCESLLFKKSYLLLLFLILNNILFVHEL